MLRIGDKVMVKNSCNGKVVDEGVATLVRQDRSDFETQWFVEFDLEPGVVYPRFVQEENKV